MIKVFMEYKVKEGSRESYLQTMERYVSQFSCLVDNYHFYEGADQPLLFVEMFDVESMEEYEKLKNQRCDQETPIEPFIQGGRSKIHIWAFKEIGSA